MKGNYQLVYYVAENVGIIGILTYPKYISFLESGAFLGKQFIENCRAYSSKNSVLGNSI